MMVDEARCPVCGRGVIADISFDQGTSDEHGAPMQQPESRQLTSYSCGHSATGPRLETADADALDVERRSSPDTV
jgi:hypothetical protein